ncbi:MAG TPA: ribosome silencing factor [Pseudoclavibacter sp.]|nr:ribosome silencing factor [Pseudoclavibacter sp.]
MVASAGDGQGNTRPLHWRDRDARRQLRAQRDWAVGRDRRGSPHRDDFTALTDVLHRGDPDRVRGQRRGGRPRVRHPHEQPSRVGFGCGRRVHLGACAAPGTLVASGHDHPLGDRGRAGAGRGRDDRLLLHRRWRPVTIAPDSRRLIDQIVAAADAHKAENIVALDVSELVPWTDALVIASADTERAVVAISEAVEEKVRDGGGRLFRSEGRAAGRWIVLDFGGAVAHIMHEQEREYYGLERLWNQAPVIPVEVHEA